MTILSFTHPQVVPNLYEFISSTEDKKSSEKWWVTKQLTGPIDLALHSTMDINGARQLFGY